MFTFKMFSTTKKMAERDICRSIKAIITGIVAGYSPRCSPPVLELKERCSHGLKKPVLVKNLGYSHLYGECDLLRL